MLDILLGLEARHPSGMRQAWVRVPPLPWDVFLCGFLPVTGQLELQWLPCKASGVIGSALGLVGLVSVQCDWVRSNVWFATPISIYNCLSRPVPEIHQDLAGIKETNSQQKLHAWMCLTRRLVGSLTGARLLMIRTACNNYLPLVQ